MQCVRAPVCLVVVVAVVVAVKILSILEQEPRLLIYTCSG